MRTPRTLRVVDRKTSLATAFTVAVVLAAIGWEWRTRRRSRTPPRSAPASPSAERWSEATFLSLHPPGPPPPVDSRVRLRIDPELATKTLRIGSEGDGRAPDEISFHYSRLDRLQAGVVPDGDGAFVVYVMALESITSEWYRFVLPAEAEEGQVLEGEVERFCAIDGTTLFRPRSIEGTLTLSALPRSIGDALGFDLSLRDGSGWKVHAEGPLEVAARGD